MKANEQLDIPIQERTPLQNIQSVFGKLRGPVPTAFPVLSGKGAQNRHLIPALAMVCSAVWSTSTKPIIFLSRRISAFCIAHLNSLLVLRIVGPAVTVVSRDFEYKLRVSTITRNRTVSAIANQPISVFGLVEIHAWEVMTMTMSIEPVPFFVRL